MSVSVEVQRNRKGEATGLTVSSGKLSKKVKEVGPSLLVEIEGKTLVVTVFDESGTATAKVNLMAKNAKTNPAKFLKSPAQTYALELLSDGYETTVVFEQAEAQRLYTLRAEIDKQFRLSMAKHNN